MTVVACISITGAMGAYKINRTRTRWFSDRFVLSPESLRMPYREIELTTSDGVNLEGWFIEQTIKGKPSDRIVLCLSPFSHDKSTLLAVARGLWDTGHSVLLVDFRAFGPHPVPQETIGHLELRDGRAALDWLRQNKPPSAKIGIMGCSMGGAVALSLVEDNDAELVGVATDCAFACLRDVVFHYISTMIPDRLPGKYTVVEMVTKSLTLCNHVWYGYDLHAVGPLQRLHRLRIPMLILHSANDSVVPIEQGRKIIEGAATDPALKQFVMVEDCEHIGSFFKNEIGYIRKITSFLDSCFEHHAKMQANKEAATRNFVERQQEIPEIPESGEHGVTNSNEPVSKTL